MATLVAFWAILTNRVQNPAIEKLGKKSFDELSDAEFENIDSFCVTNPLWGMGLSSGGDLTDGFRKMSPQRWLRAFTYGSGSQVLIFSIMENAQQARQVKPLILLAGYLAYPRRINFAKMREIADESGCSFIGVIIALGSSQAKQFQGEEDPVPYAHMITSTTLRGPRGGFVLCTEPFAESVNKGCPLVLVGPTSPCDCCKSNRL